MLSIHRLCVVPLVAGCASYSPGAFHAATGQNTAWYVGKKATIGCLDVAIDRRADYDGHAVVDYRFGNRCIRPVDVDLARVAVVGKLAGGTEVALAPYDPRLEIRAVRLDGRLAGGEAIAYPTPEPVARICVDAASLVHQQPAQWMCFGEADRVAEVAP
jgi:hypothetical protein